MRTPERKSLDASEVEALYLRHRRELRRFVVGILRDHAGDAEDVLHATFSKLIEKASELREVASAKSWLFRVAYHEALRIRRRSEASRRNDRQRARETPIRTRSAEEPLVSRETADLVRAAVDRLPTEQRAVVIARVWEDKTFAKIAEESGIPIGTLLSRMRSALAKLRESLREDR